MDPELSDLTDEQYEDLRERVKLGERLLDFIHPDWAKRVDLGLLNISSPRFCVLGQVFGSFSDGQNLVATVLEESPQKVPEDLKEALQEASGGGFFAPNGIVYADMAICGLERAEYGLCENLIGFREYDELREMWRERITNKLKGEA